MSNGSRRGAILIAIVVFVVTFICWMSIYYLTKFPPLPG